MKRLTHRGLQRATWVAVFALLVQALLPSLLHASARKYVELAEICTAFGIKKVAVSAPDSADNSAQRQHCPICSVADTFFLPGGQLAFYLPAQLVFDLPHPLGSQEYRLIRLTLHLRGPPYYA
ncbi:MAG: DUF2946 family protein [Noviherbaspirillum sp.]